MKSSKSVVEEYLKKQDWRVNENSNAPFSFGAMNKHITSEVSKDYWLREVYPEYISQAYVDGHIHIHDLGGLSLYCCGYSLKDILLKGVRVFRISLFQNQQNISIRCLISLQISQRFIRMRY